MSSEADNLWDQNKADQLYGAVILVGMTYNEPAGQRLDQFHGTVISASKEKGVTLKLNGSRFGEVFTLPPDLRAIVPAKLGSYKLRQSGEAVIDPDYTSTWVVNPPKQ